MVYPVYTNVFEIGTAGRTGTSSDMKAIADIETFSPAFESTTQEWTPMDLEGWSRSAVSGKKFSIELSGKRSYGDDGNDYLAGMANKIGQDCETTFKWTMPNGAVLSFDCVCDVTEIGGGDSTNMDSLKAKIICDGKPTYTAPSSSNGGGSV